MYVGKELLWIEILLKYCRIVQARLSVLYIARWMHGLLLFLRVQLHVGHILAIQLLKICLCYLILNHGMNNQLASNIIFQENKVCEECNLRVKKQAKFFSSHFLQWEIEFSCQGLRIFSWKWGGRKVVVIGYQNSIIQSYTHSCIFTTLIIISIQPLHSDMAYVIE